MGMFDQVEGILDPYDSQFKLWHAEGSVYQHGDIVPDVGMANTYAVRLNAPGGVPARYLTVQEGKITNLMAHQAVYEKSVFDKWGSYLGRGGGPLEESGPGPVEEAIALVDAVSLRKTKPKPNVTKPEVAPLLAHRFYLRSDLEIEIQLPADFDVAEAERVAAFVKTLPFGPGS